MSDRSIKLLGMLATIVALLIGWWVWRGAGERDVPAGGEAGARAATPGVEADEIEVEREHASIAGAVLARDALGKSVPGARVCVWEVDAEQGRVLAIASGRCVVTGADGRYEVGSLEPGRYRVTAGAPGKLPRVWTDAEQDDRPWLQLGNGEARIGLDLALADGGVPLAGTVVDVSGGPIEGAIVVAIGPGLFDHEPVATGISDAQGRFSMSVLRGEYRLRSEAPGYALGATQARAPNEAVELRLIPESVLIGRVVDESGEAVAGVTVTADPRRKHPAVVSDEQGRFRLGGLTPGAYQPEAIGEGVYGQAAMPVHVGLGQTSEPIELRVYPAFRVRGQILAHDIRSDEEQGCAGGHVYLTGGGFRRNHYADDEGWVVLDGVPTGRHSLTVYCPGGADSQRSTLEVSADVDDQRWLFDVGGYRIAGRVVDASGRGVEGVFIDSSGPGGDKHNRSGADGEFTLTLREPGTHVLSAKFSVRAEPVVTRELAIADDVEGIELAVGDVASLHGRVVDAEGRAVAGVRVALCNAKVRCPHQGTSDGEGSFGFDGLPPGRVWAVLDKNRPRPGTADEPIGEPVEIVAGEVAEVTLVTEIATGSIRGAVTAEGGPADDAWVVASRGSADSLVSDWEHGPVLCDVDGSFTLDGLGEGTWAVRAFRKDGAEASIGNVELGSTITLDLEETASVAGRVHLADGTAPAHFEIEAKSGEHRRDASFYRSEGAFELRELPAGTWHLKVGAASGSAEVDVELEPGQQIEDLDIELEPRVTIRGRAVDSRTGEPVTSVNIALQDGGFGRSARPDADGGFELEGVPPGRLSLVITPADWGNPRYGMQFPVIDIDPEPALQDLGELPLAGRGRELNEAPGELGFTIEIGGFSQELTNVDAQHVLVKTVQAGGPAAAAGLREGDVITKIDGASVEGRRAGHVRAYMAVAVGDSVVIERRDADEVTIIAAAPPG